MKFLCVEESLLMKSINRVFSFLFFVLLFACSTSEPTAEEVIPEGTHRKILPLSSGWTDNYAYAILKEEWKALERNL